MKIFTRILWISTFKVTEQTYNISCIIKRTWLKNHSKIIFNWLISMSIAQPWHKSSAYLSSRLHLKCYTSMPLWTLTEGSYCSKLCFKFIACFKVTFFKSWRHLNKFMVLQPVGSYGNFWRIQCMHKWIVEQYRRIEKNKGKNILKIRLAMYKYSFTMTSTLTAKCRVGCTLTVWDTFHDSYTAYPSPHPHSHHFLSWCIKMTPKNNIHVHFIPVIQ